MGSKSISRRSFLEKSTITAGMVAIGGTGISFSYFRSDKKGDKNVIPVYKNPKYSVEQRVDDILRLMTINEKADFLNGRDMWHFKGIERLGIPPMQVTDCGHGVTVILDDEGRSIGNASCFPTAVGQAATWNRDLIREMGAALGRETRATGSAMLLAPMVNIKRFPLNGRNYEIFSEDPLLSGELAASFIEGIQSEKVGAVIKAMTANNQQENQSQLNVNMSERTLQEIYLPSFRIPIEKANPWGVMTAYNGLNDSHTSENKHMLIDVLKEDWAYQGFVVSDWRGVHSTNAIISGLDLEMPGRPENFLTQENILKAIDDKSLTIEELDDKVRRILRSYIKTGLIDHQIPELNSELNSEKHQQLARKVSEEGIVLLKNEGGILPLKSIKKLAVIGPNAAEARLGGGGSASVTPFYAISPLEGIRNLCGSDIEVVFEEGCGLQGNLKVVGNEHLKSNFESKEAFGLKAEYFANPGLEGPPAVTTLDKTINFSWGWTNPKPEISKGSYSVRWTGKLLPPVSGDYKLGIYAAGSGYRLYMNGKLVIDEWATSGDLEADLSSSSKVVSLPLLMDVPVDVRVEFYKRSNRNFIRFEWEIPGSNSIEMAKKVAAESDAVVIFAGLSNFFEGGANDRSDIVLPGDQNLLINEIAKLNPNTVVVLINGSAVAMPWVNEVNTIVEAYYPGQEGGNAIANVLFGKVNPSGKLPETFPVQLSDNPAYDNYPGENNTVNYEEGIFIGYRHYELRGIEPLFHFGHGLSYTTFAYSDLKINKSNKSINASFKIKNTGDMDGAEVAQLYIRDVDASEPRPFKELKNFEKVFIKAGQEKKISFKIKDEDLSFFSENQNKWIVESGNFEIHIGSAANDIRLKGNFRV